MLSLFLMTALLLVAGVIHLATPEAFLPVLPPWFPHPIAIIYFTGVIELAAAAGLQVRKLRPLTAWCLVVYFIALWPAHLYMAVEHVSLAGFSAPSALWGRFALQALIVYWAYTLTRLKK